MQTLEKKFLLRFNLSVACLCRIHRNWDRCTLYIGFVNIEWVTPFITLELCCRKKYFYKFKRENLNNNTFLQLNFLCLLTGLKRHRAQSFSFSSNVRMKNFRQPEMPDEQISAIKTQFNIQIVPQCTDCATVPKPRLL